MTANLTVELAVGVFDDGSEEPIILVSDGDTQWRLRLNHAIRFAELDAEDLEAYFLVVDTIAAFLDRRARGGITA